MIKKSEILTHASQAGLRPDIIEKDYVLGWVLAGIHAHTKTAEHWIFKGGTCLKKCFFGNYRFSEDLDFTLTHSEDTVVSLTDSLCEISDWVFEQSGILIPLESIELKETPSIKKSFSGKIRYVCNVFGGKIGGTKASENFGNIEKSETADFV